MLHAKFASLSQLLLDLGFAVRTGPTFIRFDHSETETWFLYPLYAEEEEVALSDLVGTRHILAARGMLTSEQFEEKLRSISLAS
jgi:hypothetical protein